MKLKKNTPRSNKTEKTQRLVKKLLTKGVREVDIAAKLDVHFHSVTRWRDGLTAPHQGTLRKLEELAKKVSAVA